MVVLLGRFAKQFSGLDEADLNLTGMGMIEIGGSHTDSGHVAMSTRPCTFKYNAFSLRQDSE
jgi:hypothetical protein